MKDKWIDKIVKDKTFVDVGGLWGTVNEQVSVAYKSGAENTTMIDIQPLNNNLWTKFDERCESLGVTGYACIEADVTNENEVKKLKSYDVVHCSGILYHLPDPLILLRNLSKITNEYLILGSTTIPKEIIVDNNKLITKGAMSYFVPSLDSEQKDFFSKHFDNEGIKVLGVNLGENYQWYFSDKPNYAPWWWLFTEEYIEKLLAIVRLEVIDKYESWKNKSHTFLCKKIS